LVAHLLLGVVRWAKRLSLVKVQREETVLATHRYLAKKELAKCLLVGVIRRAMRQLPEVLQQVEKVMARHQRWAVIQLAKHRLLVAHQRVK